MLYFIVIFIIILGLILGLDRFFYLTLLKLLDFNGLDSRRVLRAQGYYNRSIFTNRIYIPLLALVLALAIYLVYLGQKRRLRRQRQEKILGLEEDLVRINEGDYSLDLAGFQDEYSQLRSEIYKLIVGLKSMEEEARRQKLNLKRDLSNIAHQLKTPITSIGFMLELAYEDREEIDDYLRRLELELDKLGGFTDLLLKLSQVNSNTIEYRFREISMLEIVEDILRRLNRQGAIEVEILGEDFYIQADEVWLYEAFLNIIKNSLEHTGSRVEIELETNPIYKAIRISDNGPGLEEEILDRIFDRFYRGESGLPGYGIGLNLARSIIEDHKASISAFNNGGLTFEIKFYNVT